MRLGKTKTKQKDLGDCLWQTLPNLISQGLNIELHEETLFKCLCSRWCACMCVCVCWACPTDRDNSSRWDNYGKQSLWSQGKRINTKCTLWRLRAEKLCSQLNRTIERESDGGRKRAVFVVERPSDEGPLFPQRAMHCSEYGPSRSDVSVCVLCQINISFITWQLVMWQ